MKVRIKNTSDNPLPAYQTILSAGMDLHAHYQDEEKAWNLVTPDWVLPPMGRLLVPTGIFIELPEGYEAQIRPRSGLANKHGITVLNAPGTIDADYRGEIKVLLVNLSDKEYILEDGERIAQMVIAKYERVEFEEAAELSETERGTGGYGSTGTK